MLAMVRPGALGLHALLTPPQEVPWLQPWLTAWPLGHGRMEFENVQLFFSNQFLAWDGRISELQNTVIPQRGPMSPMGIGAQSPLEVF